MPRTPNTTYQLLSVNWDREYRNLRYFPNVATQNAWFAGKGRTREGNQAIRFGFPYTVQGNYATISQYNYLRFNNEQYDNKKWFYAFIDRVEYVSEHTSNIYFTMDAYQSYLGEMEFGQCFIIRQHTENDTVNRTDEPVGCGEMIYSHIGDMWGNTNPDYIVVKGKEINDDTPTIHHTGHNIPDGFSITHIKEGTQQEKIIKLQNLLSLYKADLGDIKAVYAIPHDCITDNAGDSDTGSNMTQYVVNGSFSVDKPTKISDWTPRNKKTLYYPYCYCLVTNNFGDAQEYRFEDIESGDTMDFRASGTITTNPYLYCQPTNLNTAINQIRYSAISAVANIPFVASFYDVYMSNHYMDFVSQGYDATMNAFLGIAKVAEGDVGEISNVVGSGLHTVASYNHMMQTAQQTPNPVTAGATDANAIFDRGKYTFSFYVVRGRLGMLRKVDEYFTVFGYNYQEYAKPDPTRRSAYYYVQTRGAIVNGAIPQEVRDIMVHALDSGVTFWRNDSIGNYGQANN